jgi:phosphohistidine phosphatase
VKLWLIRHAKSSWASPGLADFDRPLNGRGNRDGPVMAAWLRRQPDPATWIWTSGAVRALATAEFVREGFELGQDALVPADELYLAGPAELLEVLQRTPSEVRSVALVAHNPGLTWLVNTLGREAVTDNLPTFGIARFDYSGAWTDLRPGSATLEFSVSPKPLPS